MAPPVVTRRFLDSLPGEEPQSKQDTPSSVTSHEVTGAMWSRVQPTAVADPKLVAWSRPLANELGLDDERMQDPETARMLGGNSLWPGMDPYAANYGGHQFGHWAGQLGDGRAIVLGELTRPDGESAELQLKGAGPTPFSRRADGRAVLRSSIREFLCSEAMHALGVPTTRALSLVLTGDQIVRDMFYDGNAAPEPGAVVCRVAPSFLRFGSYQLPYSRQDLTLLKTLADFTLENWFPQFAGQGKDGYAAWLAEVADLTAQMMAHWQAVGFVHGVLNTDNMSILGLTIDYGPYGWTDNYDLGWTPNTTDAQQHRYAFGNQPTIGLWNISRLGEALLPLFDNDESCIEAAAARYQKSYSEHATKRFSDKLGITFEPDDVELIQGGFDWLGKEETDMTVFFRSLSSVVTEAEAPTKMPAACQAAFYGEPSEAHVAAGIAWLQRWWQRTRKESRAPAELATALNQCNPKFVLRNWLSQTAIDAAHKGDYSVLERLQKVMQKPFDEQPEHEELAAKRPEWARHKPGCSALSCSS